MLTLERIKTEARRLPTLVKIGLAALLISAFGDLIGHIDAGFAIDSIGNVHEFTPAEATAHIAVLVSMVLVFVGVVLDGVRRARANRVSISRGQKGVA
jgi:hypothetical protein